MVLRGYKKKMGYGRRRIGKKMFNRLAVAKAKQSKLVKLIKRVSLKSCETKNTHQISENNTLYHNSESIQTNLLYTRQGFSDNNTGTSSYSMRIGDKLVARGLQFKFWFATKQDRPNVMFRVIFFKYYTQSTPPTTIYKSQGSSNRMIRDLDTEKLKPIKVKQFNLNVGTSYSTVPNGTWTGKEAHKYMKVYIPLKNKQIQYIADDSGTPRNFDIGFCVVAYDSYGTLTTDEIATYAYNCKFYFKDP